MRNKKILTIKVILLAFALFSLLLITSSSVSAQGSYVRSVPAYTYGGQTTSPFGTQIYPTFDTNACYGRQDFILQVDPLGCTPTVVRSDLLEQQPVAVFCPIVATQLNPLIKINAIKSMTISLGSFSNAVQTVGYQPAQAALGQYNPNIRSNYLGNIGYATIVLRQNPNESSMPKFATGTLNARMTYDIQNAFGVGSASFYLPQLTDTEFNQNINAYSFWNGKGFLKLEGADNNGAIISVYSGISNAASPSTTKTKIATVTLTSSKSTSDQIYLPGFSFCMGGFNLKLQDVENPDTSATLNVDADVLDMKSGETFLDGKCTVNTITKYGLNQNIKISCSEDQQKSSFLLGINPKINITIGGTTQVYSVGDYLFDYKDVLNRIYGVYLGFIGNNGKTNSKNDIYIRTILIPKSLGNETTLTNDELSYVAGYDNAQKGSDIKRGISGEIVDLAKSGLAGLSQIIRAGLSGKWMNYLSYSDSSTTFLNQNVRIVDYAGVYDTDISKSPPNVQDSYNKAMSDYQTIIQSYVGETYPPGSSITEGQQALTNSINLANNFGQKRTALQLCQQYSISYSTGAPDICNNPVLLSSISVSQQSVLINGVTHIISFNGIHQPTFDQYGVQLSIKYPDGSIISEPLQKNDIFYLNQTNQTNQDAIQLTDLTSDSATFKTYFQGLISQTVTQFNCHTGQCTLKLGTEDTFGSIYTFAIQKINLQQIAKVSIIPNINYAQSNASFNFSIGIEKRAIQLTPQQTKDRINSVNSTIKTLSNIQGTLDTVVKVGKTACLVTEGYLTVKNFISNLGGTGVARQAVMRNQGGWYDQCNTMVKAGQYQTVDACLLDHSSEVDASVNAYDKAVKNQNQNIQTLSQNLPTTVFLGEKVPDTNALTDRILTTDFKSTLSSQLSTAGINQIKIGTQTINVNADIVSKIDDKTVTLTQLESLQSNAELLSSGDPTATAIASQSIQQTLVQIYNNLPSPIQTSAEQQQLQNGIQNAHIQTMPNANAIEEQYLGDIAGAGNKFNINASTPVASILFQNQIYTIELAAVSGNIYRIINIYDSSGNKLSSNSSTDPNSQTVYSQITRTISDFKASVASDYQNPYLNPQVQYYETGQYAGLPAIVPFDLKNGWYAAIKSNLPILGGLTSYDASGRVSSFYVCNVGKNGKEEAMGGDDNCEQFIPGSSQQPPLFQGAFTPTQSQALANQAVNAIKQASNQHTAGVSKVTISTSDGSKSIKVGQPSANTPNIQCEDFMSPSDCNILFNVCDPVVCPSSRCNLGGAYPVQDVIQSGVVGSLMLCLPNYPQVKVPICVSGLNAGLQGYISVLKSYQQCLNTSLTTGKTVGICDEINSVYQCQFFWKQILPIVQYGLPKIISHVSNGGGEYLAGSDALTNAQKSLDYFSQYYAANSYKAFQERSTQSIGDAVCQNVISATFPGGNLFNTLITPDSPPQFYGQFDEIPYTTATNPPTSQYNVFYHIYAGKDFPAYYQVYLKGSGSSFYQDTSINRLVGIGFIPAGDSADNTTSFTSPSGYQQLCISVNGQEQCGFQKVTTDFGINSITQKYLSSQASQTSITTEANCVSGTPSAYNLLNPNVQAGVTNTINPAIYNQGIIRICSTNNPGQGIDANIGTNNSRWQQVGYCDTQNIGCWLDTQSVKNVIQNQNILNSTLQPVSSQYVQALESQGGYIDDTGFSSLLSQLNSINGQDAQIINLITPNILKTYLNNQKAELYFRRGNAYSSLAVGGYNIEASKQKTTSSTGSPAISTNSSNSGGTQTGLAVTCTDPLSCQKALGTRVIQLAQQKKTERGISDDSIKRDTGAKSFECLALQVAMVESTIQHCKNNTVDSNGNLAYLNNNPLYCEGDSSALISGDAFDSLGIMQINTKVHTNINVSNFEENVNYGIDLLISGYNAQSMQFTCTGASYSGWARALRNYNGLGCNGNNHYVEDVLNKKNEVAAIFPECA